MANFNKVYLMGNLTRDPEVRYTPKGTAVGDLGLAVNDSYKAQDGTIKETVTFINVEVWGRQAETCKQYLSKGRPVFIEGQLRLDQWEDKTSGQKRSKLKVVLENFQFIGGRGDGAPGGGPAAGGEPAESGEAPRAPAKAPSPPKETVDEDVPF